MSVELKFRVWDNDSYMSSPFTLQDMQAKNIQFTSECPVMQFVGLKDRKGVDIYEGDILERKGTRDIFQGSYDDVPGANPFITEQVIVSIEVKNGCFGFSLTYERSYSERTRPATYEIIGNIYQNPELIKPKP